MAALIVGACANTTGPSAAESDELEACWGEIADVLAGAWNINWHDGSAIDAGVLDARIDRVEGGLLYRLEERPRGRTLSPNFSVIYSDGAIVLEEHDAKGEPTRAYSGVLSSCSSDWPMASVEITYSHVESVDAVEAGHRLEALLFQTRDFMIHHIVPGEPYSDQLSPSKATFTRFYDD